MSEIATNAKMMTINPALRRSIKLKKGTMGTKDYVAPVAEPEKPRRTYKLKKPAAQKIVEGVPDDVSNIIAKYVGLGKLSKKTIEDVKGELGFLYFETKAKKSITGVQLLHYMYETILNYVNDKPLPKLADLESEYKEDYIAFDIICDVEAANGMYAAGDADNNYSQEEFTKQLDKLGLKHLSDAIEMKARHAEEPFISKYLSKSDIRSKEEDIKERLMDNDDFDEDDFDLYFSFNWVTLRVKGGSYTTGKFETYSKDQMKSDLVVLKEFFAKS
tara:strand:+ start:109 stop:930 length:822 start_codon:yes stop_codon:yes gene_type:complete